MHDKFRIYLRTCHTNETTQSCLILIELLLAGGLHSRATRFISIKHTNLDEEMLVRLPVKYFSISRIRDKKDTKTTTHTTSMLICIRQEKKKTDENE